MPKNKSPKFSIVSCFRASSRREDGFTLVETMVVVVVFMLVMSITLAIFLSSIRTHRFILHEQRIINETANALNRTVEEIREGKDVGEINKSYISNFMSSPINIETLKIEEDEESGRITILLQTRTKVDEDGGVGITLQTTVLPK